MAQSQSINTGVFNSTTPTLVNGQSSAIQLDVNGRQQTIANLGATVYLQSTGNTTSAQLASAATYTGTIDSALSYPQLIVSVRCDKAYTIFIDQFSNASGTIQFLPSVSYKRDANVSFNQAINIAGSYFRVRITNTDTTATTNLFCESWLGILPTLPQIDQVGNLPVTINNGYRNYTGATTAAAGNNILNTVAGTAAIDVVGLGVTYRSLTVQLTTSAALTSGQISFEGSMDNTNFVSIQASELEYEWTGQTYNVVNYPFGGTTQNFRTFKMPIEGFRFVRARISTVLGGGTMTPTISFSQDTFVPNRVLNVARLQNTTSTSIATAITIVNSPGANLRNYFIRAACGDGGSSLNKDVWFSWCGTGTNTAPTSGDIKIGMYSSSTTSAESVDIITPFAIPGPINTGMGVYINGGSNLWITCYYFQAP